MYLLSVLLFLLILPAISVVIEASGPVHVASVTALIGKWYVFWACGIRLVIAGVRQVSHPRFTAAEIFNLENVKAFPIVREVGFANLSMGTLGICSMFRPAWLVPAAVVGALYYGLAGLGHAFRRERNRLEAIAMFSDGFAFLVLLAIVVKDLQ